jgi:hypothetical protein
MDFDVKPRSGVGMLRFGMTTDEVRAAIALPFDSFYKSANSALPTDSFLEDAVHVFYRQPGVCEAIEFYSPSNVSLQNVKLLNAPYLKVKSFLGGLDKQLEEDESGLMSRNLGISIYAPSHRESPNTPVESVFVFEDGYYDR